MARPMRILAALACLGLAAVCAVGLAATFEPLDIDTQRTWRLIWGAGLVVMLSASALLIPRRREEPR